MTKLVLNHENERKAVDLFHFITKSVFLVMLLYACNASATIFTIDRIIGAGTVTGTVTTDDTLGVLSASSIVGWDLFLHDGLGAGDAHINSSDLERRLGMRGNALTATATELFFNFDDTSDYLLFQGANTGDGSPWWCLTAGVVCFTGGGDTMESVTSNQFWVTGTSAVSREGNQLIGTAYRGTVPEPSSLLLFSIAALGLVTARKKNKLGITKI